MTSLPALQLCKAVLTGSVLLMFAWWLFQPEISGVARGNGAPLPNVAHAAFGDKRLPDGGNRDAQKATANHGYRPSKRRRDADPGPPFQVPIYEVE
jgi:hypothetical protein